MKPATAVLYGPFLAAARSALTRPWPWLGAVAAATALFAAALPRLEVRTDGATLERADGAAARKSQEDRARFGDTEDLIVLVRERPGGRRLVSPAGLRQLASLHADLGSQPAVRGSGIRSVANLLDLEVGADSLTATPFFDRLPDAEPAFAAWLRRLRDHPATGAALLAADGTTAAIHVPAAEGVERHRFLAAVERRLAVHATGPFELRLAGPVVAETQLGEAVLADLARLIPAMVAVIALGLWLCLRTPGGVLVPACQVSLVLVWTFGAMALTGMPVTLVTTPLPVIVLTMVIAEQIHLLERFHPRFAAAVAAGGEPRTEARRTLEETFTDLVRPLVATSATTCIGLVSFGGAGLPPLRHFGFAGAFGMAAALALSCTLVPALVAVLPPRWFLRRSPAVAAAPRRVAPPRLEAIALRHRRPAALAGFALLALLLPGLGRLRVGDNWLANFDPEAPPVVADRLYNAAFEGSYRFDVVLRGEPDLFYRPEGARLVEATLAAARTAPGVAGSASHLTALGVVLRAHGDVGPASALPADRLADYASLAAVAEDPAGQGEFVTPDGAAARVRLFLKSEDFARDRRLLRHLEARLPAVVSAADIAYHFSGDIPKGLEMVGEIVVHQLRSIGFAYLTIAVLAVALFPRGAAALVTLVPIVASVAAVFGVMGYAGIPLGIATSMFGALTVGVGIDFGLHLVAAWRGARAAGAADPVGDAFAVAGRGVRWNAAILVGGFSVLALSSLRPNHSLGMLLALAVAASYLMTALLLPALLGAVARAPVAAVAPGTAPLRLGGGAR